MNVGYAAFGLVFFVGAVASIALIRQESPFSAGVVTTACVVFGTYAFVAAVMR